MVTRKLPGLEVDFHLDLDGISFGGHTPGTDLEEDP